MKMIFKSSGTAVVLACAARLAAAEQPAPPEIDVDGDGDFDADDRALLKGSETISIEDKSDGAVLMESSRAVTVVDLAEDNKRTADLGEVLSRVHGIQLRRTGALGSDARLSLNGLTDQQIRLFFDGMPLELVGWVQGLANIPVAMIQRVDVYRGVVPISLGADALGGAIDLVTDPMWVDRGAISYQVGSFGTHRATLGARVREDGTGLALGLSLFADRAKNDYPIQVEATDDVGQLVPVTVRRFHDAYTAAGSIIEAGVVKRGPLERALLRVFYSQYDKQLQHNTIMAVPYGEASYSGESRGLASDIVFAQKPWKARLAAGFSRSTSDLRDVGNGIYDWFGNRIGDRSIPGEITTEPIDTRIYEYAMFARATIERAIGDATWLRLAIAPTVNWRKGTDFLNNDAQTRDAIEAKRELTQLVTGLEYQRTAFGGALENIAFVKDYLLLSDAEEARVGGVFVPIDRTIHRIGLGDSLRYRLSPALSLKASYEWSTRIPSVDEMFGDGLLVQENLQLDPETSHNANLGAQWSRVGASGSWGGELTGFARLADNLIILVGNDRVFSYRNVYAVNILGIEGTTGWVSPHELVSLEASFAVQDIRNASDQGTFGMFKGDRIPNRPWLLGSVAGSLRWKHLVRPNDEVSLFGNSRFVYEFFRSWESAGTAASKRPVPTQLVHSVGATYALRGAAPLSTTLELQNVTDEAVFDTFGVQKPGRAVFLKVTAEL